MPVVSDKEVKEAYKEKLRERGFVSIETVGNEGYDIRAYKNGVEYYFEIKSSSKEEGDFFGSVMLTELYKAVVNKERYFFVVARNKNGKWKFKEFTVDKFIEYCTLTTPIFHYYMVDRGNGVLSNRKHREGTVLASKELIENMWNYFQKVKSQYKCEKDRKRVINIISEPPPLSKEHRTSMEKNGTQENL